MPKINLCQTTIIILLSLVGTNAQPNYNYVGGIPLRTPKTCPQGSVSGQITFQQNCCGADQTFVKLEGSACCANSTDCYDEVIAAPKVRPMNFLPKSQIPRTSEFPHQLADTDHFLVRRSILATLWNRPRGFLLRAELGLLESACCCGRYTWEWGRMLKPWCCFESRTD